MLTDINRRSPTLSSQIPDSALTTYLHFFAILQNKVWQSWLRPFSGSLVFMGRDLLPFDKLFASDRKDSFRARTEAREMPVPNLTPNHGTKDPNFPSSTATPGPKAPATEIEARISERKLVSIRAEIKESGSGKYQIWVVDLSRTGFRIKLLTSLAPTRTQFLLLPGFQPLAAHIAWREGDEYGLRFEKPLYIAVFEHISSTFPGLTR